MSFAPCALARSTWAARVLSWDWLMTGPMMVSLAMGVAELQGLGLFGHFFDELVGDLLDHDHALGVHADLPLVHEAAEGGGVDRVIHIGVRQHDQGAVAAQFQTDFFQIFGRLDGQITADFGGAGEGDAADALVAGENLADLAGLARDRW